MERTGWSISSHVSQSILQHSAISTTPSAPLRRLRDILLMAQPPLLTRRGLRQPHHVSLDRMTQDCGFVYGSHPTQMSKLQGAVIDRPYSVAAPRPHLFAASLRYVVRFLLRILPRFFKCIARI